MTLMPRCLVYRLSRLVHPFIYETELANRCEDLISYVAFVPVLDLDTDL